MPTPRNFAPLIACGLVLGLVTGIYGATYFWLCKDVCECGPAQTRSRIYREKWLSLAFQPAAMIEDAFTPWTVTTGAE